MKRILYIARNELYSLFYSPIAWILMVVFVFMMNSDFVQAIHEGSKWIELGGMHLLNLKHLTDGLVANTFVNGPGLSGGMITNLYLFLPLITMGLISREMSSGSIKLLYSSPVNVSDIVLGKFIAMLGFILMLMALLIPSIIVWVLSIKNPDFGQIIACGFSLFVILAAHAAIGLFISSLTSYQAVAAIITFVLFGFMGKIGGMWQEVEFVRYITQYMSLWVKVKNLIRGLFNLRDFSYFFIITISFLLFTVIKIKSATESITWVKKFSRYAVVVIVALIVGYITSNPFVNIYFDTTRQKHQTLSRSTQDILAGLKDGPINIKVFANVLNPRFGAFERRAQLWVNYTIWEPYIRFKPDINIEYVYYYDIDPKSNFYTRYPGKSLKEIALEQAKTYKMSSLKEVLPPESISQFIDTKKEGYNNLLQITYNGKTEILRTFSEELDVYPTEGEIAATLKKLIVTPPKIVFLTGEMERSPNTERDGDYRYFTAAFNNRYALVNQGLGFDTLSANTRDIPTSIAGLVIADPRLPFSESALRRIKNYISRGGNLLITAEPDKSENLKQILDELGVVMRPGLLIQPSIAYETNRIDNQLTQTTQRLSPVLDTTIKINTRIGGDSIYNVVMRGAGTLSYQEKNGFKISTLLITDSTKSWNRIAPIEKDSLIKQVAKRHDDENGSFVTSILLERAINDKNQKIIVSSDADYLTRLKGNSWGSAFGFYGLGYFTNNSFPIDTRHPESLDDEFYIERKDVKIYRIIFNGVMPVTIGIFGIVLLMRRRRK
jgi:ABC-2 type transport system permease protein